MVSIPNRGHNKIDLFVVFSIAQKWTNFNLQTGWRGFIWSVIKFSVYTYIHYIRFISFIKHQPLANSSNYSIIFGVDFTLLCIVTTTTRTPEWLAHNFYDVVYWLNSHNQEQVIVRKTFVQTTCALAIIISVKYLKFGWSNHDHIAGEKSLFRLKTKLTISVTIFSTRTENGAK